MFEPIPEPGKKKNYFVHKDEKQRIRFMGTTKDPVTFIQCWVAWEVYEEEDETGKMVTKSRPHREEFSKAPSQHLINLDRKKEPKSAWNTIIWHVDEDRPLVWEITQSTIKEAIKAYANNPAWGELSHYILEISHTGTGLDTRYSVTALPPLEVPAKAVLDEIKETMIDVRALVNGENNGEPFGALSPPEGMEVIENIVEQVVNLGKLENSQNDQVNIKELRDAGEPIPMPKRRPVDDAAETVHSAGSITRDAVETLRAIQDKQQAVAPEMKDGMPY